MQNQPSICLPLVFRKFGAVICSRLDYRPFVANDVTLTRIVMRLYERALKEKRNENKQEEMNKSKTEKLVRADLMPEAGRSLHYRRAG